MATSVSYNRWIVVTVRGSVWMPVAGTPLFDTQAAAQAWASSAVTSGYAKPGSQLLVKHILLSEII